MRQNYFGDLKYILDEHPTFTSHSSWNIRCATWKLDLGSGLTSMAITSVDLSPQTTFLKQYTSRHCQRTVPSDDNAKGVKCNSQNLVPTTGDVSQGCSHKHRVKLLCWNHYLPKWLSASGKVKCLQIQLSNIKKICCLKMCVQNVLFLLPPIKVLSCQEDSCTHL